MKRKIYKYTVVLSNGTVECTWSQNSCLETANGSLHIFDAPSHEIVYPPGSYTRYTKEKFPFDSKTGELVYNPDDD
jgi:hypothetical protein